MYESRWIRTEKELPNEMEREDDQEIDWRWLDRELK